MEMRWRAAERVHLAQQISPRDRGIDAELIRHTGDVGVEAAHHVVWGPHEELGPVYFAGVPGRNVRIELGNVGIEGSTDFRTHAGA